MLWEETEGLVDLGTATSTSAPGEYTEKLSMKALLQLLPHAERGLQELGLDRMVTDGRNKGMTKRDAMVRDITALIEYGRQNHVQDDGVIEVSVTYHYKYTQLGRRYADAQVPTLQSMGSGIRKTAGEGTYWDLDFQDCYNTILYAVAKHFHFPEDLIKLLYDMTEDKDKFRQDVAGFYGCTPKAAKNLLLKHWMGGKVGKWLKDFDISLDVRARVATEGHHEVVGRLEDAAPRVRDLMIAAIPALEPFLEEVNAERSRAGEQPKTRYTAMSYGLQDIEDKLLAKLQEILKSKGYTVGSLQYDGLYVERNGAQGDFPRDLLKEIEAELAKVDVGGGLTVPMKLDEKDVQTPYGDINTPPRTVN